jgi:type II secretory pathway pseudopilin PulG
MALKDMRVRGYTLLELLISLGIIIILLISVGAAIVDVLHVESAHTDRAGMSRSASNLAARLDEEARSSTAVFIPQTDVTGNPNSGAQGAHEVDFFRRLSAGGDALVAYSFDSGTGSVTRYEYTNVSGLKTITQSDLAASGIASFSVSRQPVANTGTVVGQSDPASVTIFYGRAELAGGNDVVIADITAKSESGVPNHLYVVHLATRAAPTSLAILAPNSVPPSPTSTHVFPFIILRPGFPVRPPHGPMHGGSPGAPSTLIHWVTADGSIQFVSTSGFGAVNWFDFTLAFAAVSSGIYTFRDSNGSLLSVTISCVGGRCPVFRPLPVSAPAFTGPGVIAFQLSSS